MNEEELVIAPANNFGITIKKSDISMGKVIVNGVEVTDVESWNKAVSTFSELEYQIKEKEKEIDRLNTIINELEKYINKTKLEEFEKVYGKRYGKTFTQAEVIICNMILNKLKELKVGDKE